MLTQTANDNLMHSNGIIKILWHAFVAIVCLLGVIFNWLLIEHKHVIFKLFATFIMLY